MTGWPDETRPAETIAQRHIGEYNPDMPTFRVAGASFDLEREAVERAIEGVLPEPILEHYVVVGGRRFPPKQVLVRVTGLDRADFTTHQARRILKRLGFVAARSHDSEPAPEPHGAGPYGGRQASILEPYVGQWVALASPTEVLVAARTPEDVLHWLARHERRASYGMLRVPESLRETEGAAPS